MENKALALFFLNAGYSDYLASRFLLNNGLIVQGATIGSSAVEKYLKMILALHGVKIKVHMDKLDKLQTALSKCYLDITQKFDHRFFELCGKAYQMRYYDDLKGPITMGFFVHQFLGEMDHFIHYIEHEVIEKMSRVSLYKRDTENKNEKLYENNYLFSGMSKKLFMEQPGQGFCIYFDPEKPFAPILVEGKDVSMSYDGTMWEIKVNFS